MLAGAARGRLRMMTTDTDNLLDAVSKTGPADDIFAGTQTFDDLGLRSSVLKGVHAAGFERPTGIQAQMIPIALAGRDILGQAKTGTGKTAAFALPLLHLCDKETPLQALVLAPTRELAIQITGEINELGRGTPIRAVAIYGGERIAKQHNKLKQNPQIIVATPGRVMDMVGRGLMHFNNVKFAVLDEVDRMLDIGFREDIRKILSKCPKTRQTIFVSATISSEIDKLARQYMHDPEKIVTSSGSLTVSLVEQHYLHVEAWDKKQLLLHLLTHEEPALTLVFCRLKRTVDNLSLYLQRKGIDAHALHADLNQSKRNQIMTKFRTGKLGVLIASDLASRGIDVDGISHVINYDLPEDPDLYVHRIGRTARAGRGGIAWAFVTPEQGKLLTQIELLINAEIPKMEYPDFKPGPVPEDVAAQREIDAQRKANITPKSRFKVQLPATKPEKEKQDPAKFPGGVVPTRLPPKRMHGKTRGRRGR
jgi:ATP-dependent RNA helicase DeaD